VKEQDFATKVGNLKTHEATIDYTLENFEATYRKYKNVMEQ